MVACEGCSQVALICTARWRLCLRKIGVYGDFMRRSVYREMEEELPRGAVEVEVEVEESSRF